jgi:hypothetical protein
MKHKPRKRARKSVKSNPASVLEVHRKGTPQYEKMLKTMRASARGKKALRLFNTFWKHRGDPPSVMVLRADGSSKPTPLNFMGFAPRLVVSSQDKGKHGGKTRVIHGRWLALTDEKGKRIFLLNPRRPLKGALKPVGYAKETWYVPTEDIEAVAPEKAKTVWRHKHGHADAAWLKKLPRSSLRYPRMFADRNGVLDQNSSVIYGSTPSAVVRDWMYG